MQDSLKRVDAFLSSLGYCTRSEAKRFIKIYEVCIDEIKVTNPSQKAKHSQITINGEPLDPLGITILLNKPKGFICSHSDQGRLIYSLLPQRWQRRNPKISTVGRLDIDTTGAILLTDDGALNSRLCSPKHKVAKVYVAELEEPLRGDEVEIFAKGELLLKSETKPLLPAKLTIISEKKVELEIYEGRYHQVKRMFASVGNKVVNLHRKSFGEHNLKNLEEGNYKIITKLI